MRLRFACLKCEATIATTELALPAAIACPECGESAEFGAPSAPGAPLVRCLACGGPHLFIQKDFPRRLGLSIVVLGAGLFLLLMGFEWIYLGFGTLFAVALLDVVIYRAAPLMTVCYHCSTEFRGASENPEHGGYDPKIAFYTAKQADSGGSVRRRTAETGADAEPENAPSPPV